VPGPPLGPLQLGQRLLLGCLRGDDFEDPLPQPPEFSRPERLGLAEQVLLAGPAMLHRQLRDGVGDDLDLVDVHFAGGECLRGG